MQQVHLTPARSTSSALWDIPVMSALVNSPNTIAHTSFKQMWMQQSRLERHRLLYMCLFTSDCKAPSSTMMSLVDWSLVCVIVVRLQSKKPPRHFCFTSGRVMNLYHHVWKDKKVRGFISINKGWHQERLSKKNLALYWLQNQLQLFFPKYVYFVWTSNCHMMTLSLDFGVELAMSTWYLQQALPLTQIKWIMLKCLDLDSKPC